jgi:hypothetical protein
MRAVGTVQSDVTPSTAIMMLEVATMRAGPMATQSAAYAAQQARRPSEKEESAMHMVSKVQPVVTPPPLTEAPLVERVEGYVSVAYLGAMVTAQAAASTSVEKAVLARGLP